MSQGHWNGRPVFDRLQDLNKKTPPNTGASQISRAHKGLVVLFIARLKRKISSWDCW